MSRFLPSATIIARRDYIATALSRSFILFLVTPLFIVLISGGFAYVKALTISKEIPPVLLVVAKPENAAAFLRNYKEVRAEFSDGTLPDYVLEAPQRDENIQARESLKDTNRKVHAVLVGLPNAPHLIGPRANVIHVNSAVKLALDHAQMQSALSHAGAHVQGVSLAQTMIDPAGSNISGERAELASGSITVLFMLNMMLAGMLLSNLVEEKSNKIIEILVAAVPVDSVFFGKLIGMLCVSLTGVAVWGGLLGTAYLLFAPPEMALAVPAVGWPAFLLLGLCYFVASFLLLGAMFLGIGAQANSVREIQTLSMPVTFSQVLIFMFASLALNAPHGAIWKGAALFPLSSPLVMFASAATEAPLWPHVVALLWQAFWVVIIVRLASNRFRVTVLKSGPVAKKRKR